MKLSKRSIMLLMCVLAATTLTVASTIAYLTDTANMTNTFTVGKVQIKLDETQVNPDGTPVTPEARTETGNNYHLIPGCTYTKDPTTTVLAGSEESYIRMKVTITEYAKLEAAFLAHGETFTPSDWITKDPANTSWTAAGSTTDEDGNLVLEYRYSGTVSTMEEPQTAKVLQPLFNAFTVPGFLTGDEMKELQNMQIQVRSDAIQTAGFTTVDEAWAAFDVATTPASTASDEPAEDEPVEDEQPETGN